MNWATRAILTVINECTTSGVPTVSKLREDIATLTPAMAAAALQVGLASRLDQSVKRCRCPFCDIAVLEMFRACQWDLLAQAIMGKQDSN